MEILRTRRTVEVLHLLVYSEYAVLSHGSHSFREQLFPSLSLSLDFWYLWVQ